MWRHLTDLVNQIRMLKAEEISDISDNRPKKSPNIEVQRSKTDGSKPPNNTDKPNGIIVRFAQYNTGDKAYRAKKLFKRTTAKIHILEQLNTKRMKPLDEPHKNTRTSLQIAVNKFNSTTR